MLLKRIAIFCLVLAAVLVNQRVEASHLRAANIELIQKSNLTYTIILSLYTDTDGVQLEPEENICVRRVSDLDPSVLSDCEEVTFAVPAAVPIIDGTDEYKIYVDYTFPSSGRYVLSWNEDFRNKDIINLGSSTSDQVSMYVQTQIKIGGSTPQNSSPQFTLPPIDLANVGEKYIHNPGAYDPDGDSLIFQLVVPKARNVNIKNGVVDASEYVAPSNAVFGGASTFSIDAVTGIITWNTPNVEGLYVIAFVVKEVRNGIVIGEVTRDMQILVKDFNNEPPVIVPPADLCVVAGDILQDTVIAYDPDLNTIILESFGLPNEQGAKFKNNYIRSDSIIGVYTWDVGCEDVKEVAYLNSFKVTDQDPQIPLSDSKSRSIKVVGPAPLNLTATPQGKEVVLSWDNYMCSNISKINIWRRECEYEFDVDTCEGATPAQWGFRQIGEVIQGVSTFTDDNLGLGLTELISYNYLITADFNVPQRGKSLPSNVARASISVKSPILYQVTADTTRLEAPVNIISWHAPFELLASATTEVKIIRQEIEGFAIIGELELATYSGVAALDSFYVDSLIDPLKYYTYSIAYNSTEGQKQSAFNSVVLGEATNTDGIIELDLNWQYDATWGGADTISTYIWKEEDSAFVLYDSVNSFVLEYKDENVTLGDTFCYIIETHGVFCHDSLVLETINFSQKFCGAALDEVPPCPPIAAIIENDCDNFDTSAVIQNEPFWFYSLSPACEDTLVAYRIYEIKGVDYELLKELSIQDTSFLHTNITSYAKCYVVTAVDLAGNESDYSNEVCNDNCESIRLPNVLTITNHDGKNDSFNPFPEDLRFVNSIEFEVYNRWGSLVYYSLTDESINWDGRDLQKNYLSPGTYFYSARVVFDKLHEEDAIKKIKGWIQIF